MKRLVLFLVVLALGLPVGVTAQSLGEVARKEEARRKQLKKPAKVYTNRDLRGGDEPAEVTKSDSTAFGASQAPDTAAPAEPTPGEEPPPEAAGEASEDQGASQPPAATNTRDEWQKKLADARSQLERSQMFAEALQTRINSLTTDFTNRDDPAQRAAIETERKRSIAELDRVKREIADQQKAITDIQEQARRAGVPPGWLR